MSTAYAGNDTNFPTSVTIPSDGDDKAATSVNAALEGLADRTAFLGRVTRGHFGTVVRAVKGVPMPFPDAGKLPSWLASKGGEQYGGTQLWQSDTTNVNGFTHTLELPHGATLQTVYVSFKAATGHGAVPANVFLFEVMRHEIGSAAHNATSLVTTAAASGSVGAYEAFQQLSAAVNTVVDNSKYIYYIRGRGEFGADSAADARYHGALCVLDVSDLDVGAG